MSQQTFAIRRPKTDDCQVWDIVGGVAGYPAVFVAHDLKLFPLLNSEPRTLSEVCDALKIEPRPARALLALCASLGLLHKHEGFYSLTRFAEEYFLPSSPAYFGGFLDVLAANFNVFSCESLKRAVLTNSSQVYRGEELFKSHEAQAQLARAFTRGMHGHSMAAALAWPDKLNLAPHKMMLDVGGGSGAHSIGAALRWPHLSATVLDLPPVCDVAREFIREYDLHDRVGACPADMWADEFPAADLHFYADIFHDWPPEKGRLLAEKSFAGLPPGGRIVIHEMLLGEQKTGPFAPAAYSVAMLLWTEGQQYSGRELTAMLSEVGFVDLEVLPTFGYWSVVAGTKPDVAGES